MAKVKVRLEASSRIYFSQVVEMEESEWKELDSALDDCNEELAEQIVGDYIDTRCILLGDPLEDIDARLEKV